MVVCNWCDCEIKDGDKYKIAYDEVWCIECTDYVDVDDNFGMTYVREDLRNVLDNSGLH